MKLIHLNHSDIDGGAARAAYRIHNALLKEKVDSKMWVNLSISGDWTVESPFRKFEKVANFFKPHISNQLTKLLKTKNSVIHSPSIFSSRWIKEINKSDADIIHLHWIQQEMLSISDIKKIRKPIVWTLHDMWAFCGAEHYTYDERWKKGYTKNNRPNYEKGFDLNLWTWKRKKKFWRKPLQLTSPSNWLASCARESELMRSWPIEVIPHPINSKKWRNFDKNIARKNLNLPSNIPLLLFGAIDGGNDPRKGFNLLLEAINHLKENKNFEDLQLVVFGQRKPKKLPVFNYPVHFMGHLYDDLSLSNLYSSADVMIVPSRQEAFGQTALEANSCGTPVVAFDIGGLSDIVEHKKTGFLAKPFNTISLSDGISWSLNMRHNKEFKNYIIEKTKSQFSEKKVAKNYIKLYQKILGKL